MNKKIILSLSIGVAISGVAFYFAFKNVPFGELTVYFTTINYLWLIPSLITVVLTFILRGMRWQVILGAFKQIGFWRAFNPLMIGFMINCILPGRVGEIARPMILKKKENVPFSSGLATVTAERVFDLFLLIFLLTIVLVFVNIDPDIDISFGAYHLNKEVLESIASGMLKFCLVLIAGIIFISINTCRRLMERIIMFIPYIFLFLGESYKNKIKKLVSDPLIKIMEGFATGFILIKYPKKIVLCLLLSLLIWTIQAFSYYLMTFACPGIELSFFKSFTIMILTCFFIALPSVPGYWGLWEAGGMFAMSLFGISLKEAAGYTLVNHVVQIFPVILVGLFSAMAISFKIRQITSSKLDNN